MKFQPRRRTTPNGGRGAEGLTLIELMLVVALLGILVVLANSAYPNYRERIRVMEARDGIAVIAFHIKSYLSDYGRLPASLSDLDQEVEADPWGRPYHYTDLTGPGKGKARKDRKLNPLNSDFDLFSAGKDGVFKTQISNKDSLDDVIRANDGGFVDLASKY